MAILHLEWRRANDPDSYEIEKREPAKGRRARVLEISGDHIVFKGGATSLTTPLKTDHPWRVLADTEASAQGALAFVQAFGFLRSRNAKEEPVSEVIEAIDNMRDLLNLGARQRWPEIAAWLERNARDNPFGGVGKLGLRFDLSGADGRPSVQFQPGSLLSALYVQALLDMSEGVELKKCRLPGCLKWFAVGVPHGRRADAEYCSVKHQKQHAYLIAKGEAK